MYTHPYLSWLAFWLLPISFALANSTDLFPSSVDSLDTPPDRSLQLALPAALEVVAEEGVSSAPADVVKKPKARSRARGVHSIRQYRMQNHKLRPMRYRFHRPSPVFKGGRYSR